ncbi:MAG: sulfur oxidation c-type cytochrome SoxA [Polaromonas sp.]|nr:sulfur oxidation c-type cytochrome SoxA [Polaromonas sp.]
MSFVAKVFVCCSISAAFLIGGLAKADPVGKERQSSYELMSADTQAMQDDPLSNPANFAVLDGQALWHQVTGNKKKACATCHGDANVSMKGVAAGFPKLSPTGRPLLNLGGRINQCRTQHQDAAPFAPESRPLLSLSAFVATQSKGMPITVDRSPANAANLDAGERLFNLRLGQLNLSCAQCHADRSGQKLAGSLIPQAHPTAYPIYRLEWQSVGSLERRLRNCLTGVRAEPYAFGSRELLDLELFLAWRARGMPLESPGVRP